MEGSALYVAIGKRIRQARVEAGMTQAVLAQKLGTTQDNISLFESGKRNIQVDTLYDLARKLGKPRCYFIDEDEPGTIVLTPENPLYEIVADVQRSPVKIEILRLAWRFVIFVVAQYSREPHRIGTLLTRARDAMGEFNIHG